MLNALQTFICLIPLTLSVAPDTLRHVNVLYRHGDRSPVSLYPKDPIPASVWPQGLGWLSQIGMQQHFALGQFLRSEYDGFLSAAYNNSQIAVESSAIERCLMSAYCNLAGLYPPNGSQVWNSDLLWQPIPVQTRPTTEDNKLAMGVPCPRYDELYAQELHSPVVKEEERINAEFYKMVANVTGVKKECISEVWKVADTIFCEKTHNLTLPVWTQQQWGSGTFYTKLMELKDWGFSLLSAGTELSRLKGGPLLKEFIYNMQNVASDPNKHHLKMHMYSAHDSTVAAVTSAMKVYNNLAPPYAVAVLVELHENNSQYCVQIRYHNDTTVPPFTLQHPDCKLDCCPLDQFIQVTKDRVPVDWTEECKSPNHDSHAWSESWSTIVGLVAVIVVLLILLILLSYAYYRRRHHNDYKGMP